MFACFDACLLQGKRESSTGSKKSLVRHSLISHVFRFQATQPHPSRRHTTNKISHGLRDCSALSDQVSRGHPLEFILLMLAGFGARWVAVGTFASLAKYVAISEDLTPSHTFCQPRTSRTSQVSIMAHIRWRPLAPKLLLSKGSRARR